MAKTPTLDKLIELARTVKMTPAEEREQRLSFVYDERFWIATIAVLVLGARYANQLKLTDIDANALLQFLVSVLQKMRAEVNNTPVDMTNSGSISTVLQQFLNDTRARHTLVTDKLPVGPGKPPPTAYKVLNDASRLEGVHVQIAKEMERMRVETGYFRQWLTEKGYTPHNIITAVKEKFGVKDVKARLGSGTQFCTNFQASMLDFDLKHPELRKFFEW